jgi:hypothetical protein
MIKMFIIAATIYIVTTLFLLLSSISRWVFSSEENSLTILLKDVSLSLFWVFALFSEKGWTWLRNNIV